MEVNIGREENVEGILAAHHIPVPLRVYPSLPNGNLQTPSQKYRSRAGVPRRVLKRRKSRVQLHTGLVMEVISNSERPFSPERHTDDNDMGHHGDDSKFRILSLCRRPVKIMTAEQLVEHFDISYDSFSRGLTSYVTNGNKIHHDQLNLVIYRIIDENLRNCEIPVWDFVRFLTRTSQVNTGSQKYALCNMPLEDIIYAEPTVSYDSSGGSTAAVVVNNLETTESQVWGGLCRVRIIFGFPDAILKNLPDWIKRICPRLAFVDWYSHTASSGDQIYQVSSMKDDRNLQICGIIPVSDLRGRVPLSVKKYEPTDCITFLVDSASLLEIARAECKFDLSGRKYRSLVNAVK